MSNNIKEVARKVLKDEAEGIALLDSFFDENFTLAIKKILEISGKVIVTGVGKSGHIGKKISATLSSTGTPSYFVHPTEASHGDMGMVGSEDIIFAISWSGETSELNDIVHFSKQNNIKLISLTSSSESHLASSADISLILPKLIDSLGAFKKLFIFSSIIILTNFFTWVKEKREWEITFLFNFKLKP